MVSITGMMVSSITDLRFPSPGQQGHEARIIQPGAKIWRNMRIMRPELNGASDMSGQEPL